MICGVVGVGTTERVGLGNIGGSLEFARGVVCLGAVISVNVGIADVVGWFFLEYLMKVSINRLCRIGREGGGYRTILSAYWSQGIQQDFS